MEMARGRMLCRCVIGLLIALSCAAAGFAETKLGELYVITAPGCGSCAKMKAVLNELDTSALTIREVGLFEMPEVANALFERYGVPESECAAPMVFVGTRYVGDVNEARVHLSEWIADGEAARTLAPNVSHAQHDFAALGFAATMLAGFVAGLNPCALSMLLFFMALLLPMGKGAFGAAAAFLATKLAMYLALGTLLAGAFSRWNPDWLPLMAKLLLTVFGGLLVILNLMDAISARRAKYGEIRNQLPRGVRGFLHVAIKRTMDGSGKRIVVSAALLGLIVAASEFLCSGQLYLAMLTAGLERGEAFGQLFGQLFLFCVMFLLPSVLVCGLLLHGKREMALSTWMLNRMPLVKCATAAVMLLIIAGAWVL